jgi:hypothetical protein
VARYARVQGLRKPLDVLKSELGRASTYARIHRRRRRITSTDAQLKVPCHSRLCSVFAMTEVQTPGTSDQQLEEAGQALYSFNFSDFLRREYRFGLDPNRPSCKAYLQGHCPLGSRCPDKHHVSSSYNK